MADTRAPRPGLNCPNCRQKIPPPRANGLTGYQFTSPFRCPSCNVRLSIPGDVAFIGATVASGVLTAIIVIGVRLFPESSASMDMAILLIAAVVTWLVLTTTTRLLTTRFVVRGR